MEAEPVQDTGAKADKRKVDEIFAAYKGYRLFDVLLNDIDADDDVISMTGMEKLANDLKVDPDGIDMFIVAYSLGATGMLQISKEEFIDGMNNLRYQF